MNIFNQSFSLVSELGFLHVIDTCPAIGKSVPRSRAPDESGSQRLIISHKLQPSGVGHIGLAAGHMLGIVGIHHHHGEPGSSRIPKRESSKRRCWTMFGNGV